MPHRTKGALAPHPVPTNVRRLLLLAGLSAVALAAPLAPQATTPALAGSCGTNWHSRTQAPDTIKVLRSRTGEVETVDFRQYVGLVMASGEFPAWLPDAVLEVGATAVKQYAWYYTLDGHHRSGYRAPGGECYDVRDDTGDQLFRPEKANPKANQLDAVAATWALTLRKNGRFFLTGYRAGTRDTCASDVDGWRIYARSAQDCAERKGWSRQQIQEAYYKSHIEFVWSDVGPAVGSKRDAIQPKVSAPRLALVVGQQLDRRVARVTWSGSDAGGSGLARYRLQRRIGAGAWRDVTLQGVRATTFRFRLPTSSAIRFRVRSIDAAGNRSAWRSGPSIDGKLVQSQRVTLHGPWRRLVKPAASGGTSRYTIRKGARAVVRFRGRSVAIVAPVGPGRGKARIILDGKRVGTLDLNSPDTSQRRLVWARSWAKRGHHTLRIVTLGTDGRPRFDLDAFLIAR